VAAVVTAAVPGTAAAPARHRGLVLAVCCLSVFLGGLDTTIVTIGLPAIGRSLHAGVAGLQWAAAAYTVTLASFLMLAGTAADRIGRRAVLQTGLALFVLGSWLCSLAPGLGWLIAFRVVQGAGGSMLNPAALGIITSTFTGPAERARAVGAWDGAYGLSMVSGPLAGGMLIGMAGWRAVFWAAVPPGLAAIALIALLVPESRAARPRRPDPPGQLLVTVMVAALAGAIISAPGHGWLSAPVMVMFAAAAASLAALAYCEPRRADPLIQLAMFRSPPLAAAVLAAVCGIGAVGGFGFLSTLYLQDVRGLSPLRAGLAIWPMAAEMAVCAPLAGRVIARRGTRLPAAAAGAALMAGSAALTRLTGTTPHVFLAAAYALFGAGAGALNPSITYGIMSRVPGSQAGLASGLNSTARQLGQSLGVAVTGTVLAGALHGPLLSGFVPAARAGWWVMAGCGAAVSLAGLAGGARRAAPARHARPGRARGAPRLAGRGRHCAAHPAS
jgi:EmrB/QacA subfamily drug resistance transporter